MESKTYLEDIQHIKKMMENSSQFISLSGLSGILAGVYALVGAFVANILIENHRSYYITLESLTFKKIIFVALLVLIASITTAYFLTIRKAKKQNEKVWNATSKKLLLSFSIPLLTGGIFSFLLLKNGFYGLIAPVTLIFYGLACVNASKYTFRDVQYLGITQVILGLIAVEFSGYGLYFWVLGFGICHILYGSVMYYKYDFRN
jgi:hypothetical protein